jgi:DNA repair protein RAD16
MELDESVDSEMREERQSVSRASTSSIQDSAANSGYSTPATSAVATPAPFQKPKAPVSAMQRARSLRNSKYSLNPTNSKRKRGSPDDEDEDEDEDDDEDNTADAQLARALQEQENSKLNQMTAASDFDELTPSGRFKRLRAIRPKADYALGSSDESDFQSIAKIPTPKRSKTVVPDSNSDDDSDFSMTNDDDDDDDDDDDVALAAKAAARVASDPAPAAESDSDAPIRNRLAFRARAVRGRPAVRARPSARRRPIPTRNAPPPPSREQIAAHNCANIPDSQDDSELTHLSSDSEDYLMDDNNLHRLDPGQRLRRRARLDRDRLEMHHPELLTMWEDLKNLPQIEKVKAEQPKNISRELKPFQLEGLSWMKAMEQTEWGGGLLGDEMGMGKTIQAVSLIMSDYPAKSPSLVLIPPVALMQWQQEIGDYTDGTLKTFVFHGTNAKSKNITVKDLKKYDVILMSYNSLESLYRFQEKGRKRKGEDGMETVFQKSVIHQIQFHRVILDEAHNIKVNLFSVIRQRNANNA